MAVQTENRTTRISAVVGKITFAAAGVSPKNGIAGERAVLHDQRSPGYKYGSAQSAATASMAISGKTITIASISSKGAALAGAS